MNRKTTRRLAKRMSSKLNAENIGIQIANTLEEVIIDVIAAMVSLLTGMEVMRLVRKK